MRTTADIRIRVTPAGTLTTALERTWRDREGVAHPVDPDEARTWPAIWWPSYPLFLRFDRTCTPKIVEAWRWAAYHINADVLRLVFVDMLEGEPDIVLGSREMRVPMSGHAAGISAPPNELGFCIHEFVVRDGLIRSCACGVDASLDRITMRQVCAHELCHAIGMGHDPDSPARLTYPTFGGAGRLMLREREWAREIVEGAR